MKNVFDRLIRTLDMAEERISELEGISIETSKTEKKENKDLKKKTQKCEATTKGVIYKMRIPEREGQEEAEEIFEMIENFPK